MSETMFERQTDLHLQQMHSPSNVLCHFQLFLFTNEGFIVEICSKIAHKSQINE